MNTPHKTEREIALLSDQACKHRLGHCAKVLSPWQVSCALGFGTHENAARACPAASIILSTNSPAEAATATPHRTDATPLYDGQPYMEPWPIGKVPKCHIGFNTRHIKKHGSGLDCTLSAGPDSRIYSAIRQSDSSSLRHTSRPL